MSVVAVIGVATALGRALLARLEADPGVERVVGIDHREPSMPVAKLDFRPGDVRDPVLATALEGVDTLVHLAGDELGGHAGEGLAPRVHGTRNLLRAAGLSSTGSVVHVSTALAYGAHEDNTVPLTEAAALRAGPEFPAAYHAVLAEELVASFASEHRDRRVVVLRPVTTLGIGVGGPASRFLESPLLPLVRGYDPPVQFIDVDDLAAAVHLVVSSAVRGPFNVAADGWLTTSEVCRLVGRPAVHVPEALARMAADRLSRWGLIDVSAGALPCLMHPWVVDTQRLRACGWVPQHTNRDILRSFASDHRGWLSFGRVRVRSRALGAFVAGVVGAGVASLGWGLRRRARSSSGRAPAGGAGSPTRRRPPRADWPRPTRHRRDRSSGRAPS